MKKTRDRSLYMSTNPYKNLSEGDAVLLGSLYCSPSEWRFGKVLWHDACEVLVEQSGIAGNNPQKNLVEIEHVRAFGSWDFCSKQKRAAEQVALDTVRQLRQLEDMVSEVRSAVNKLIAGIDAATLKASAEMAAQVVADGRAG